MRGSHEDDLLLAETVLRHIREGSTQLRAFDEVGDKLNRTSAACGFRWNAEIRNRYEQAVAIAKRQRKEKKRAEQRAQKPAAAPVHQPVPVMSVMETQQAFPITMDEETARSKQKSHKRHSLLVNILKHRPIVARKLKI